MTAMRDVWADTLIELMSADRHVLVLDGDLGTSTRADRIAAASPGQFFQMGIAEQNMVGVAAGLAANGYVPWLSSFAVFLTHRALDQVRMLLAQTGANVKLAGHYAGLLTGQTGKTHQDVQDIAIMRAMPGMTVLAPVDASECARAVRWATACAGPVYLRLSRDPVPPVAAASTSLPEGAELSPVVVLRDGADVTLVSTGAQSGRTLAAAERLAVAGVEATVVHLPVLKPINAGAIDDAIGIDRPVFSVEEHSVIGGVGSLLAEIIASRPAGRVLRRIGIDDTWGESAPNDALLARHGLTPEDIARQVARSMAS
jgi:transketolase